MYFVSNIYDRRIKVKQNYIKPSVKDEYVMENPKKSVCNTTEPDKKSHFCQGSVTSSVNR